MLGQVKLTYFIKFNFRQTMNAVQSLSREEGEAAPVAVLFGELSASEVSGRIIHFIWSRKSMNVDGLGSEL